MNQKWLTTIEKSFTDTDSALKPRPFLKQYFAKLVPPTDNKLLPQPAVWSGGTFIYVPKA